MGKPFIINESDRRSIKKMYGLLSEESGAPCTTWKDGTFKNGDGIKTPKITIVKTPTLVSGTYEGPESGFCIQHAKGNDGDSVHQLAGITVFHECGPYLKELYKSGTYVIPVLEKITMQRKPNFFEIKIPLIKTTEDKAITSINERGSMGGGWAQIDDKEVLDAAIRPMFEFVQKNVGDMFEIFFSWRNLEEFPIKTTATPTEPTKKPEEVKNPEEKKGANEPQPSAENPWNQKPAEPKKDEVSTQNVKPSSFKIDEIYSAKRESNGYTYKIKIWSISKVPENKVTVVITGPGVKDYFTMNINPEGKLTNDELGAFSDLKLLQ